MRRALVWILAVSLLAPAVRAADNGWPDELGDIQRMVKASVGDIPYDKVKVKRQGDTIDIAIKLKHVPRQFRSMARQSTDDDLFLATNVVELFEPDLEIVSYDLVPLDFVEYYFGFALFNFGKKIKREAIIEVIGPNGTEFLSRKKRLKYPKNSIFLRFTEQPLSSGPGLYALYTKAGPWELTTYFCASCT